MKKVLVALMAIVLVNISGNAQQVVTAQDLNYVGADHNRFMDQMYNELKNNPQVASKKASRSDVKKIAETFLKNTVKAQGFSAEGVTYTNQFIGDVFAGTPIIDPNNLITENAATQVNAKALPYFDKIKDILNQTNSTIPIVNAKLGQIEASIAAEKFDNKTLIALYSATSVAKHSFEYWTKNGDKWQELGSNTTAAKAGPITKADVAGAVGAAVGAVAANIIVGPGTVAYGGAIIFGGVAGSVTAAILSWW